MTEEVLLIDVVSGVQRYVKEDDYVLPKFRAKELMCPTSRVIRCAPGFLEELHVFRRVFNDTMNPSSVCRSVGHNKQVGGHRRSTHICNAPSHHFTDENYGTCGIDLPRNDETLLGSGWYQIKCALSLGWSVGLAKTFVHYDRLSDYSSFIKAPRIFFYGGSEEVPAAAKAQLQELFKKAQS